VGIITPSQIGVLPSLEVVVWVAAGGRGTLIGACIGAVGINAARSQLTARFPEWWPIILGSLFVGVVLLFPDGVIGIPRQCRRALQRLRAWRRRWRTGPAAEPHSAPQPKPLDTPTSRTAL
jgi:hypothetical protein